VVLLDGAGECVLGAGLSVQSVEGPRGTAWGWSREAGWGVEQGIQRCTSLLQRVCAATIGLLLLSFSWSPICRAFQGDQRKRRLISLSFLSF
jgi:hypothetical protein